MRPYRFLTRADYAAFCMRVCQVLVPGDSTNDMLNDDSKALHQ